jgi:hypothetical protein
VFLSKSDDSTNFARRALQNDVDVLAPDGDRDDQRPGVDQPLQKRRENHTALRSRKQYGVGEEQFFTVTMALVVSSLGRRRLVVSPDMLAMVARSESARVAG